MIRTAVALCASLALSCATAQQSHKHELRLTLVQKSTSQPISGLQITVTQTPAVNGAVDLTDLSRATETTDNTGIALFRNLPAGTYNVLPQLKDFRNLPDFSVNPIALAKDEQVSLAIPEPAALSGRVVLSDGTAPKGIVEVVSGSSPLRGKHRVQLTGDGTYRVDRIISGSSVKVSVVAEGAHCSTRKNVEIDPLTELKDVNFELRRINRAIISITGTLTTVSGERQSVPPMISYRNADESLWGAVIPTLDTGTYQVFDLPNGNYVLEVGVIAGGQFKIYTKEVSVREGGTASGIDFSVQN